MGRQIRQVIRSLSRAPAFTLIAVVTLGIGVAASTAIFSVVEGVLISSLPYPEADRLVQLFHNSPGLGYPRYGVSPGLFFHYRDENPFLESAMMFGNRSVNLTGDGDPERVMATGTTYTLVDTLRVSPQLGRFFALEEDLPDANPVAVISDQLWKRRYGGRADIIGKSIRINEVSTEVIGVMPEGCNCPDPDTEIWLPSGIDPAQASPGSFGSQAIARLIDGAEPEDAQTHIRALIDRFNETFEGNTLFLGFVAQGRMTVDVVPLKQATVGDLERSLWVLLATVGVVMLIACGNVANLFLVRAEGQQGEMAVRYALGAGRFQVAGQYLLESSILSVVGGLVGVGLAAIAVPLIVQSAPSRIPRLEEVGLNASVLGFSLLMIVAAAVLIPAAVLARYSTPNPARTMNEASVRTTGGSHQWFRNVLVVSQTALALVLLVAAGLMIDSFRQLQQVDSGFSAEGVLTFRLSLPGERYETAQAAAQFHERLLAEIEQLPGVEIAGAASNIPLATSYSGTAHDVEEFPTPGDQLPPMLWFKVVSPGYFRAMGIPLLAGRGLENLDHQEPRPVAVVSQAVVDRFWSGQDVLGKRLRKTSTPDGEWHPIVGVAGDVHETGLDEEAGDVVYYAMVSHDPETSWVSRSMGYAVRTSTDPMTLVAPIRRLVGQIDPNLPIAAIRTLDEIESAATSAQAFTMTVLSLASVVALILGAVGLYGVISYRVSQRRRELGIRIALGAQSRQVAGMVVSHGMVMAAAGLVVGLAASFALTRVMSAMLFETSPTDPVVFIVTPLLLLLVAFGASYLPARRAARIDPSLSLRV